MAVDLKQGVSLSSVGGLFKGKKGSGGGSSYPTKTTMNLYQTTVQTTDFRKTIIAAIVAVVFVGLFVKFGVLDQLQALSDKQAELSSEQAMLESAKAGASDFEELKTLYDGYMTAYGSGGVDAIAALDLVEQHVMPVAEVSNIVLSDNTLTLTLINVPLDTVGNLAKDLESQPSVTGVNVTNAATGKNAAQSTTSTLVVTLKSVVTGEGK